MKRVVSLLLCFYLLFSLCGCSKAITEGEVCEKRYEKAHTTVMMLPLAISNGKTTTTMVMPYLVSYPERYVVFIKAYQNDEWKTEDFYVSKEVYDTINIGDMFLYDEERGDLQDEPYTKERVGENE